MSPRARAYLAVVAVRSLLLGMLCLVMPATYIVPAEVLRSLPLHLSWVLTVWAGALLAVALAAAYASIWSVTPAARVVLMTSVVLSGLWTGTLVLSLVSGAVIGWAGTIVLGALTVKDIIMLADPMRVPPEDRPLPLAEG